MFNAADDTPNGMLNLCSTQERTDFEGSFPHALSASSATISNGKTVVCIAFYQRSDSAETTTNIISRHFAQGTPLQCASPSAHCH